MTVKKIMRKKFTGKILTNMPNFSHIEGRQQMISAAQATGVLPLSGRTTVKNKQIKKKTRKTLIVAPSSPPKKLPHFLE